MRLSVVVVFSVFCSGLYAGDVPDSLSREDNVPEDPYAEASEAQHSEVTEDRAVPQESSNNFYPSFSRFDNPPLGHSRPFYFNNQQEGAYSQRSQPFQQLFDTTDRFSGYKEDFTQPVTTQPTETHALLGSGNFGVIPGGTFYSDNEGAQSSYKDYDSYFHNGHGRPSSYVKSPSNPKPYKHEQFANFRDFADINTPSDRQYSQYVVVYVNKNSSDHGVAMLVQKPNNIIESLALLDLEAAAATESPAEKKLSKSKRKLAKLLPEKKYKLRLLQKAKASKDMNEPLLALS